MKFSRAAQSDRKAVDLPQLQVLLALELGQSHGEAGTGLACLVHYW